MTRLIHFTVSPSSALVLLLGFCAIRLPAAEPEKNSAGTSPFEVSAQKQRTFKATASRLEYEIVMDGSVDMDNTLTRHYEVFKVAFQPNISLEIANTGQMPVVNPRVIAGGRGKWWCIEELLKEILAGADNDQEKALLIWDFVRKHRYHDLPLFVDDELHDPVKFLCVYGAGLCDDSAAVGCSLLYHAGLNDAKYAKNPKTRHLHGHVMCEAYLKGGYQFLDIDENVFYLDRENERIVSGDALTRDHGLAKREHAYGPIFKGWQIGATAAALFGSDDGAGFRVASGHSIDVTLRPGERIVYRWDNIGKIASDGRHARQRLRFWGNSLQVYSPRLEIGTYKQAVKSAKDIVAAHADAKAAKLAGATKQAHLVYEMKSPYVVCGGRVRAEFLGLHDEGGKAASKPKVDRFAISLSVDGDNWKQIWSRSGKGRVSCCVSLDEHLGIHKRPPKYRYFVRVSLESAAAKTANLCGLTLETDLMTAPLSLPRLRLGKNRVVYTDETTGRHEVTITHQWRESKNIRPPDPPLSPIAPAREAVVRASTFVFQWAPVENAVNYHIQVSRYADMKLPYRPCFDVIVEGPTHGSPFLGMFSPGTDYYWRVRSRNKQGVWSRWSDVWHFRWDGPRVPVKLKHRKSEHGEIVISWEANPRGPRPDHYEVYASDERGFSISKKPYNVTGLGKQPPNFLRTTKATEMLVVSPKSDHPNMNRSFYRVVAVDQGGTRSGPSDYVELPHPYIYSGPVTTATVGKPYRNELKTLRSIGDLQHRYATPTQRFWEREEYEFRLLKQPGWLKLDPRTGVLTGKPGPGDIGTVKVEIVVKRLYPHEIKPSAGRGQLFQKTASRFQAEHRHSFLLRVQK